MILNVIPITEAAHDLTVQGLKWDIHFRWIFYHKHNIHKVYLHFVLAEEGWKSQNVTFAYVRLNRQAVATVMRRRSTVDWTQVKRL